MNEYILAKTIIGLLYKHFPDALPLLALDLSTIDFKVTYKYLRHFGKDLLPDDLLKEYNEVKSKIEG